MAGFEHALFLLLLLVYLVSVLPEKHPGYLYLILGGLLFVLLPPVVHIEIPWDLLLALVLPWIFWRSARNWLDLDWRLSWREVVLWVIVVFILAVTAVFVGGLRWEKAAFFGFFSASMLWQALGGGRVSNPLASVGALALVFLLVETSLSFSDFWSFFGSLFSGASVGIAIGLLSAAAARKAAPRFGNLIFLGQAYLAYWAALAMGVSGIATALFSVIVFAEFAMYYQDTRQLSTRILVEHRLIFFTVFALFVFLAWQIHQPAAVSIWIEAGIGLCVGFLVARVGRRWGLPDFVHHRSAWYAGLVLSLFLLGVFILWPRDPDLNPAALWIGFGSALFLPVLSMILLSALHDLHADSERL